MLTYYGAIVNASYDAYLKEYVPVISRPRAILNKKKYKWGNIYTDVLVLCHYDLVWIL